MALPAHTLSDRRRLVAAYGDAVSGRSGTVDGVRERFGYGSRESLKVSACKARRRLANGATTMNLTANDISVLRAMSERGDDFGYMTFGTIAADSGVDRKAIRRIVRRLARGGLVQFAQGLWSEDGRPAGAGYAITSAGRTALTALDTTPNAVSVTLSKHRGRARKQGDAA